MNKTVPLLLLLLCSAFPAAAQAISLPMTGTGALKEWSVRGCEAAPGREGITLKLPREKLSRGTVGIFRSLPVDRLRGRRVSCSIEVRAENLVPGSQAKHFHGGKFLLWIKSPGGELYPGGKIAPGSYGWQRISFRTNIPADAETVLLTLGFQNAGGKLEFRNFSAEADDTMLDLSAIANMDFSDETAGDGKGGWSDQGRDSDARNFDRGREVYGGVPFVLSDPARNGGRSVLSMYSTHFPNGRKEAELRFKTPLRGKYLYLLHALCWGNTGRTGELEITSSTGKTRTVDVIGGRHVDDWWRVRELPEAWPGAKWTAGNGSSVGLFTARFALDSDIARLKFRSAGGEALWIIAGATVSDRKYTPVRDTEYVIEAGGPWKPLKRPESPCILPGSALDLSSGTIRPVERIIVNAAGRFARQSEPEKAVRFYSASGGLGGTIHFMHNGRRESLRIRENDLDSHEKIDRFVREIRRQGYNMYRIHMPNMSLGNLEQGEVKLKPAELDLLDYLVSALKKNGIYLMIDALGGPTGYSGANRWLVGGTMEHRYTMYFDAESRKQCEEGMRQLFTHRNPYTGTRLIDDPVLALITGCNEQEFAFIRNHDFHELGAPAWRRFLREKYGSAERLNAAWKTAFGAFSEVPAFTPEQYAARGRRGADLDEFIARQERGMIRYFTQKFRQWGYKGLFTNFDMTKSMHYSAVRGDLEVVTMHSYFGHLSADGTQQSQGSMVGGGAPLFRDCASTRIAGKPFMINEYGHLFWNRYRYEEALGFTAFAAMNDVDGLMAHEGPAAISNARMIDTWAIYWDPVKCAQQLQGYFLFLRGDISPACGEARIRFSEQELRRTGAYPDALGSAQSRLSLVTKLTLEQNDSGKPLLPAGKGVAIIPLSGNSRVENNTAGFSQTHEAAPSGFNLAAELSALKKQGILPEANRSGGWTLFESETGELLLDANRKLVRADTPRFQGMAAPAETALKLSDIEITRFTTDGNLSVIALDGTIRTAKRLLVVYATNALNSGMTFTDRTMTVRKHPGKNPTLVRTGTFTLIVRNENASQMKAYPLELNGERRAPIPLFVSGGRLELSVDTGTLPGGPVLYFEIAR